MKYLLAFLLLLPASKKSAFVPIRCMTQLTVHSWGTCKKDGAKWDCEAAHVSFIEGCISVGEKPATDKAMKQLTYPGLIAPGQNPDIGYPEQHNPEKRTQNEYKSTQKEYDTKGNCKPGDACDIIAPGTSQDVNKPQSQDFKPDDN